MNFNVTVQVKPYVKRFLENNYGNPVNFNCHPREKEMFRRMLKKPIYDNDHRYKNELCLHATTVDISISDRDFYRHGWELSKTDTVSFGKHFERHAKWMMRTFVAMKVSFGCPLSIAIEKFQNRFMMEEEYWPAESIKKDFDRFKNSHEIDFNQFAYQHMEKLILSNMYNVGAITSMLIQKYESAMVVSQ